MNLETNQNSKELRMFIYREKQWLAIAYDRYIQNFESIIIICKI